MRGGNTVEKKPIPSSEKKPFHKPVVITKNKDEINDLKKKADEQHQRTREESGHGTCIALG